MALAPLQAEQLINSALASVNDAIIKQLEEDILKRLHDEVDAQLEEIARAAAAKVFVRFSEFYQDHFEWAATLRHVLEIRRQQ